MPDRQTNRGQAFRLNTPDWMLHIIELANGIEMRLTTDFYVSNRTTRQTGIEFHGDLGSLHLEEFSPFNAAVSFATFGEKLEPIPLLRKPAEGVPWGRGVHEMVQAMFDGRPHRFSGEQAAHICDILDGSTQSIKSGTWVDIDTTFPPPKPADWLT
jgi:predicted dehydrogenase